MVLLASLAGFARGQIGQIDLPKPNRTEPILVSGRTATRWTQGGYDVWVLQGDCRIVQGNDTATSDAAVLWILRPELLQGQPHKMLAYLEGHVNVHTGKGKERTRLTDRAWFGRFTTVASIDVHADRVEPLGQQAPPAIYVRGMALREAAAAQAREPKFAPPLPPPPTPDLLPGTRRLRVFQRSDIRPQIQSTFDPRTNQWVVLITSGVNLVIEGVTPSGRHGTPGFLRKTPLGTIDIATDRMVIWTNGLEKPGLVGDQVQSNNTPLEIYMEGNIEFRQGDRTIYADRMYYDVTRQVGTILNTEILTPAPKYQGLLRLRAEMVEQVSHDEYYAEHAYLTSSRMGAPTYRLQAGSVVFDDRQVPVTDPLTGAQSVNPATGEPVTQPERMATAQNALLYLGDVPVFYWPTFASNLEDSSLYVRRMVLGSDSIFGTRVEVDPNMYQVLGIRHPPKGTEWDGTIDYLSYRGLGLGTKFLYDRDDFLGIPGPAAGLWDFFGIRDHGTDDLGLDRLAVPPSQSYRYRLFGEHRQMLPGDIQLSAEVGLISDRNFLNEYFEQEYYEMKDENTGLELKQIRDNSSWSVVGDVRVNDFVTQTSWLPRGDHFWLGQSLLWDRLTWFEHTSLGYAQFNTLAPPGPAQNPGSEFRFLPWEVGPTGAPLALQGMRFTTRHEVDLPLQFGPVKFVPYALGEFGHWGEDLAGQPVDRLYGQVGMRASVPAWRVDPDVESVLWNVHGLAHKVVFDAEFAQSGANRDLTSLPLYDPLDDWEIEDFRRRFVPNTFAPPPGSLPPSPAIPLMFDERFYALRTGLGDWVTSPVPEIAGDLTTFRLGMQNRWQTKRGPPDDQRIVDWITFDADITFFPDAQRDNFGVPVGLVDYNARWQVGDRFTLLSSGIFDFFTYGQRIISIGGFLDRPPNSGLYLGLNLLDGPIANTVLSVSYSYRLSEKWVTALTTAIDLRQQGNIGENVVLTRVGESFLVSGGFNVDVTRGAYGGVFMIEPRFLPKTRYGHVGGTNLPTAGAMGLE